MGTTYNSYQTVKMRLYYLVVLSLIFTGKPWILYWIIEWKYGGACIRSRVSVGLVSKHANDWKDSETSRRPLLLILSKLYCVTQIKEECINHIYPPPFPRKKPFNVTNINFPFKHPLKKISDSSNKIVYERKYSKKFTIYRIIFWIYFTIPSSESYSISLFSLMSLVESLMK